jgi:hypothetical protein
MRKIKGSKHYRAGWKASRLLRSDFKGMTKHSNRIKGKHIFPFIWALLAISRKTTNLPHTGILKAITFEMQNTFKIARVRILAFILVPYLNKTGHVDIECF